MSPSKGNKRKTPSAENSSSLVQPSILSFFGSKTLAPSGVGSPPVASSKGKIRSRTASKIDHVGGSVPGRGDLPPTVSKRQNQLTVVGCLAVKATPPSPACMVVTRDLFDPHADTIGAVKRAKSGKCPNSSPQLLHAKDRSEDEPSCAGSEIPLNSKRFTAVKDSHINSSGSGATVRTPTVTSPLPAKNLYAEPAAQAERGGGTVTVAKKRRGDRGSDLVWQDSDAVKRGRDRGKSAVGRGRVNVRAKADRLGTNKRELPIRRRRQGRNNEGETAVGGREDGMEEDALESTAGGASSDSDGGGGRSSSSDGENEACGEESYSKEYSRSSEQRSQSSQDVQEELGQDDGQMQNRSGKGNKPNGIPSSWDKDCDGSTGGGETLLGMTREQSPRDEAEKAEIEKANGISEYELQRLERIRKNQAFMASLGLCTTKLSPSVVGTTSAAVGGSAGATPAAAKKKKRSRPVSRDKDRAPSLPVRRSARARGTEAVNYSEDKPAVVSSVPQREPEPEVQEIDFDDSTVLKYLCRGKSDELPTMAEPEGASSAPDSNSQKTNMDGETPASQGHAKDGGRRTGGGGGSANQNLVGMRLLDPGRPLSASGLPTIYTMRFCGEDGSGGGGGGPPALLAAGGKGGVIALFSTQAHPTNRAIAGENSPGSDDDDDVDDERTLMNFKAHKGWVSAVRFLAGGGGSSGGVGGFGGRGDAGGCCLLSSANDSVVRLWDISKQHKGVPRLLCTNADLHPTRKGIFAMDTRGGTVATGSKDATVAIAFLTPTGLRLDRVLGDAGGSERFHEKVIKGVDIRDNMVASCGDDSNVRVSDIRECSNGNFGVSHRLDRVHAGACHTVRWHPGDDNLLLTAGLDSTVKLFDLRRPEVAVHVFRGHCPYALARPKAIHRPEFVASGGGGCGSSTRFSVLTCGEQSDKLSMYDAATGAAVSRGLLGAEASALAVGGAWDASGGTGIIAAATPGGDTLLLGPVWGKG